MTAAAHLRALESALDHSGADLARAERWGRALAVAMAGGARLLAAGNGGSAAEAQHLTSELVGRFRRERPAFSALSLHAEGSALTAIANDYGAEQAFARQVEAHGRGVTCWCSSAPRDAAPTCCRRPLRGAGGA